MAFRRTYRKKNAFRKKTRKFSKKVRRVRKRVSPVRAMVRREIRSAGEVKSVQYGSVLTLPVGFSTIDSPTFASLDSIWVATPGTEAGANIPQGTNISTRIGNQIRTKRLKLTAMFYPAEYNAGLNPFPAPLEVCLWAFKIKPGFGNDTSGTVAGLISTSFLTQGAGDIGATGMLDDLIYPINKEVFEVKGIKRFKIGFSAYGNAGVTNNMQHFHNNDYKMNQKIVWDLTDMVDKRMTWNDTGALEPSNRKLYIFVQALRADGTTTVSAVTCHANYSFDYDYTDS